MLALPTGTVTLLFTDIEGSTRLLQQLGERYADVLAECRRLLGAAFQQHHGHEVDTQGDAFFIDLRVPAMPHTPPWQPNAPSPAIAGLRGQAFVCAWVCTPASHCALLRATWGWMCITPRAS